MDKSSFLADIGKIVAELKEVDVAYVFGSFLERDDFYDIDVALLLSEELERQIKPRFEFDVRILNIAPVEFQFEVIRKGCTIFSREESRRIDYESEVISIYLDLNYMYDFLDKEFLART